MPKNKELKNILVVRNDRFGEFLLNIPALRAIKETYPKTKITAVVSPEVKELALETGFIDQIFEWDKNKIPSKIKLISWLRKNKFDAAIMLNPSKDFNICTFLAGIPLRVGYDRKLTMFLTDKIKDLKKLGLKHEVDYNLELVNLIGAKTQNRKPALTLSGSSPIQLPDKFITIHPWTSDKIKKWPVERFAELANRITKILNIKVIIIGGPENIGESSQYFSNLKDITDLTGTTSLKELGIILKKSLLLVSADSGPVHLAACVDTPVIVLFRNDLPGKTSQRWGPLSSKKTVIEKPSLQEISVEEVFKSIVV